MASTIQTKHTPVELIPRPNMGKLLLRCYAYLKPHWRLVAGSYLCLLGINALTILLPQFIRGIIDRGISGQDMAFLTWSVLGLLGLTLVKGVLTFIQGRSTEKASQSVAFDLRNDIQRKLTILPFSFHDQAETGELLSRAVQDVERIRFLTGRATERIIDGSVLMVVTSLVLLWMNPRLALLAMLSMPLLVMRALYFGRRYRPLSMRIQKQLAVLTTQVEQNLRGSRVVKAFAQEQAEVERFEQENQQLFNLAALGARMEATNMPLLNMIANLASVLILFYGGRLVVQNQLTLGELVAFTTYLAQLVQPVRRLGMIVPMIDRQFIRRADFRDYRCRSRRAR